MIFSGELEMKELDMVIAKKNLSNNVPYGCIGTIVFVYEDPSVAYEVEFCDQDGNTVELRTVTEEDISEAEEKVLEMFSERSRENMMRILENM